MHFFRIMKNLQFCLASLLFAASANSNATGFELITNYKNDALQISKPIARSIYFGYITNWPNGLPIRLIVMNENNDVHFQFTKKVLGLYPYQIRRIWDRQTYSGTGTPPVVVSSQKEMKDAVGSIPGAIGYVLSTSDLPESVVSQNIETTWGGKP